MNEELVKITQLESGEWKVETPIADTTGKTKTSALIAASTACVKLKLMARLIDTEINVELQKEE